MISLFEIVALGINLNRVMYVRQIEKSKTGEKKIIHLVYGRQFLLILWV